MPEIRAPFRIGVDVGGTFTDLVLVDAAGRVLAFKSPSNPVDPAEGVLAAVRLAAAGTGRDAAALLADCALFVHGSTIATNTLLERKGVAVGLLTTAGFRDSLEIRRGLRPNMWDHRTPYPEVLVPRYLRRPVTGRLDAEGKIVQPLDPASVEAAVQRLRADGAEAVAIALLHSYRNPAHEHECAAIVRRVWPEAWISCSADVAPVIGEYERTSTVVLNAYIAPRVIPYLQALDRRLGELGLRHGLLLVQSNGGAVSVAEVPARPASLLLSGPAAGVGALRFFGRDTGSANLVSIEVGGTSCDVTLMQDGAVGMADQIDLDDFPLVMPAVEIHTVGAGGGTLAGVDHAGMLQVGPRGAGARPGPAAYGLGGTRPTVTDAQLVLGRLKPGPYAGGAIVLDEGLAREAVRAHVAEPLGIAVEAAAAGIIRLVEQNVLHAVERVSIERGYNPRQFTLVAAGGAGPLHGVPVARALGCAGVYVPRLAGVFCAFGMCNADIRHDSVRSWLRDLDGLHAEPPDDAFAALEADGRAMLARQGFAPDAMRFERAYDLRYAGQQWTVNVPCEDTGAAAVRAAFEAAYRRLYGYVQPEGRVEIVNLRLTAVGLLPPLTVEPPPATDAAAEPVERRAVWIDERLGMTEVPVYDGRALRPGQSLDGPAIVDEATTTILVGAGDRLTVTGADNYLIALAR